jgi:hypothetical protein
MNERIAQALTKLFDRYRIVFWYDAKQELRDDFETLQLPFIEKLELTNNEYGLKYRILGEEPEQKFLLYREGPPPADLDNWLLDVQLSHGEFRTKLNSHKIDLQAISIKASVSNSEKTKSLKEIEKVSKMIAEIEEYEREVLYPLATKKVEIDLDDGVKVNYPKFGAALKKIPGLDAKED